MELYELFIYLKKKRSTRTLLQVNYPYIVINN